MRYVILVLAIPFVLTFILLALPFVFLSWLIGSVYYWLKNKRTETGISIGPMRFSKEQIKELQKYNDLKYGNTKRNS